MNPKMITSIVASLAAMVIHCCISFEKKPVERTFKGQVS